MLLVPDSSTVRLIGGLATTKEENYYFLVIKRNSEQNVISYIQMKTSYISNTHLLQLCFY